MGDPSDEEKEGNEGNDDVAEKTSDEGDKRGDEEDDAERKGDQSQADDEGDERGEGKEQREQEEEEGEKRGSGEGSSPKDTSRESAAGESTARGFKESSPKGSPKGSQQGSPKGSQQGSPKGSQQGSPKGSQQGSPKGSQQGSPKESQQGSPKGSQQGSPNGSPKRSPKGSPPKGESSKRASTGPSQRKRSRVSLKKGGGGGGRGGDDDDDDDAHEEAEGGEAGLPPSALKGQPSVDQAKLEQDTIFKIRVQSLGLTYRKEAEIREKPFMGSVLENQLTEQELEELHHAFQAKPGRFMDKKEFIQTLHEKANVEYSSDEMDLLFSKMDTDKDGKVDWNEFLSYVLLEIQAKSAAEVVEDLVLPLSGHPPVFKSRHRFPIVRVAFFPVMQPDRTVSFLIGRYATISRDGRLNYWTLDFELDGTAYATSGAHRVTETWVMDMVCLPDVAIACTCSTNKDLCFFDTTAKKFELRVTITHLHQPVVTLGYHFWPDDTMESLLLAADMSGNVLVFYLNNRNKGPFQYTHSCTHVKMRLDQVEKGRMKNMSVRQFIRLHSEMVKQVGFFSPTRLLVSCAACDDDSLVLTPLTEEETVSVYSFPRGINCFHVVEEKHQIVAGCMNGSVVIYDVFVQHKAVYQLLGHTSPVIYVVAQDEARRVYSMARDRSVKCWDVPKQKCIQTYPGVPSDIGSNIPLSFVYNPVNRNMVVAGNCLVMLVLGVAVDKQRSDGYTHTMAVVRAMYNPLYKCVVTVGLDSVIMVWDVWEGKRTILVRDAHTRSYYGVPTAMEITAAAFDPAYHFLITGARDGSLKIWNFNMGYCVRTMNIEPFCEVTGILWMHSRILAIGWDRHVTEFSDEDPYAEPKVWETRHTDDVLFMAAREGESIVTTSYNGELVLWRADTGQAYRRYNVGMPHARIVLTYTKESRRKAGHSILRAGTMDAVSKRSVDVQSVYSVKRSSEENAGYRGLVSYKQPGVSKDFVLSSMMSDTRRRSMQQRPSLALQSKDTTAGSQGTGLGMKLAVGSGDRRSSLAADSRRISTTLSMLSARRNLPTTGSDLMRLTFAPSVDAHASQQRSRGTASRRVSVVRMPDSMATKRPVYASAVAFLKTRPMKPDWGTLMVAIDKGFGQVWSHHPAGSYLGCYLNIHMAGDYVTAMTSDKENKYLFTGTSLGYIKIWLLSNFAFPNCHKVNVCMPLLRLQFPFMWKDRVEGRAKRSLRDQPLPVLLSSYRGHIMAIHSIEYMDEQKIVMTSSADTSVRLWSLSGLYLGTLGGHHEWTAFSPMPSSSGEPKAEDYKVPADIRLVMSSTTLKVMQGGNVPRTHFKLVDDSDLLRDLPKQLVAKATCGRRPGSPLLGHYIRMQEDEPVEDPPYLNVSCREIPVYTHLRISSLEEVKKPKKPPMLVELRRRQRAYMTHRKIDVAARTRASVRSFLGSFMQSLTQGVAVGSRASVRPSVHHGMHGSVAPILRGLDAGAAISSSSEESEEAGDVGFSSSDRTQNQERETRQINLDED